MAVYQHPLAYLVALEGLALMRAWGGGHDRAFVEARLTEVRRLLDDPTLAQHPGVVVDEGATEGAYREWAATYDDPGNDLFTIDGPVVDGILRTLPPGDAADVACGTGRLTARLAELGHRVVGVDTSPEMLDQARRRLPAVPFVVGDLLRLPLPDDSMDLVTCGLALTHVRDLTAALAELARILRPGGAAVITDVHPGLVYRGSIVRTLGHDGQPRFAATYRHTVGDYLRASLAAGFTVRRCEEPSRQTSGDAPDAQPPAAPAHPEVGDWTRWPWTLLEWVPDAARAAWAGPAVIVWHLRLA
jgi:SAM-dependent methyltransferase